jgi:hypothetical protein
MQVRKSSAMLALLLMVSLPVVGVSQSNGTLRGTLTIEASGTPVHSAIVTITQLKRAGAIDLYCAVLLRDRFC